MIRDSGLKIWMVTGDNIAVTKQICILAGFKRDIHEYITIENVKDEYTISLRLSQLDKSLSISNKKILVIDNTSYKTALRYKENYFYDLLKICSSVIICNLSPS